MQVQYVLHDYVNPLFPGFPRVSYGYYYAPEWSAHRDAETGRVMVLLDGNWFATFFSMEDAADFIGRKTKSPWGWDWAKEIYN